MVLYIGKAKSLRPRVASYFQPGANLAASRGADIQRMIEALVVDVDVMECESEVEALLRENRLIKDIQPPDLRTRAGIKACEYAEWTLVKEPVAVDRRCRARSRLRTSPSSTVFMLPLDLAFQVEGGNNGFLADVTCRENQAMC